MMNTKTGRLIISLWIVPVLLNIACTVNAALYTVPLNVTGDYEFGQLVTFNINLGVAFSQINDVRFQAQGTITAVDAPGLFECTFIAAPAKWKHAYGPVIDTTFPPEAVPFTCDAGFISSNGATWDFLLDGTGNGYVALITNMYYIPEFPPEDISGTLDSACIVIDAVPIPEPVTVALFSIGGLLLRRRK